MEIRDLKERKTLAVNRVVPFEKMQQTIGEVYGLLSAYCGTKGLEMSGPPYVLYRNMDMQALDMEMGFLSDAGDAGEGEIVASALPAGRAVVSVHQGPYSELEKSYVAIQEFAAAQGVQLAQWMYECYLNSPQDTAPEELLTELYYPLATARL